MLSIDGKKFDLLDVAGSALVNGTNPSHKDYWQASPADSQNQRQVESSIIAWSLWLLRDTLLPQMSSLERQRIDAWLASCTVVPVRKNNWAWFTAVNHAARTALKDRFDEFSYDRNAMFDDLRALDGMYAGGGWYNDDKPHYAFDYYNSWVFASHYLYWNAMVGSKFPEWSRIFGDRLRSYLGTAPLFFGSNGSHILYGRSLIYRWAVSDAAGSCLRAKTMASRPGNASPHRTRQPRVSLEPLALSIARKGQAPRNVLGERHTETFGNRTSMAGIRIGACRRLLWLIPREDPFWNASGGQLPVEKADFVRSLETPGWY